MHTNGTALHTQHFVGEVLSLHHQAADELLPCAHTGVVLRLPALLAVLAHHQAAACSIVVRGLLRSCNGGRPSKCHKLSRANPMLPSS